MEARVDVGAWLRARVDPSGRLPLPVCFHLQPGIPVVRKYIEYGCQYARFIQPSHKQCLQLDYRMVRPWVLVEARGGRAAV